MKREREGLYVSTGMKHLETPEIFGGGTGDLSGHETQHHVCAWVGVQASETRSRAATMNVDPLESLGKFKFITVGAENNVLNMSCPRLVVHVMEAQFVQSLSDF